MTEHLCTNCHSPIKPVVAIDIDGTLGKFHNHFITFLEAYLQKRVLGSAVDGGLYTADLYDGGEPFHEWCERVYDIDYRTWQDIKLAYRQGAQKRSMPIYWGGKDLVDACIAAGAEIWMTTTRPYMRLDNIDPDTRFWLKHNGFQFDHMLYDEDKYAKLDDLVGERVVGVLDDLSEQCDAAAGIWGYNVPIQRMTPWNRNDWDGGWTRVGDLQLARGQLTARIEAGIRYNTTIRT